MYNTKIHTHVYEVKQKDRTESDKNGQDRTESDRSFFKTRHSVLFFVIFIVGSREGLVEFFVNKFLIFRRNISRQRINTDSFEAPFPVSTQAKSHPNAGKGPEKARFFELSVQFSEICGQNERKAVRQVFKCRREGWRLSPKGAIKPQPSVLFFPQKKLRIR
ncbi:MAG: hypothetical protein D6714_11770 [Bacteroidetes bacterium]|nr:MAG: hypothetical protein D6714_11770 [Bacteroidota bacterium]